MLFLFLESSPDPPPIFWHLLNIWYFSLQFMQNLKQQLVQLPMFFSLRTSAGHEQWGHQVKSSISSTALLIEKFKNFDKISSVNPNYCISFSLMCESQQWLLPFDSTSAGQISLSTMPSWIKFVQYGPMHSLQKECMHGMRTKKFSLPMNVSKQIRHYVYSLSISCTLVSICRSTNSSFVISGKFNSMIGLSDFYWRTMFSTNESFKYSYHWYTIGNPAESSCIGTIF